MGTETRRPAEAGGAHTRGDKRERLLRAAADLFHRRGVHRSTLAEIAQQAEVPLGNVYYHFRTKESLVEAVIESHLAALRAGFVEWERDPDLRHRLVSFIRAGRARPELVSLYGCPRGSLCQELGKGDGDQPGDDVLAARAGEIFRIQLEWLERQFHALGKSEEEATELAADLLAALQGASLLTNSLHEPDLLLRQIERLETWLADSYT